MLETSLVVSLLSKLLAAAKRPFERFATHRKLLAQGSRTPQEVLRDKRRDTFEALAAGAPVGTKLTALFSRAYGPLSGRERAMLETPEVVAQLEALLDPATSTPNREAARARIRVEFAKVTGRPDEADEFIDRVASAVAIRMSASQSAGEQQVALVLGATLAGVRSAPDNEIQGDLRRLATSDLRRKLHSILAHRHRDPASALTKLRSLVRSVQSGEHEHAENVARAEVFTWAARLEATSEGTLERIAELIQLAREADQSHDVAIPGALLVERRGNVDDALAALRAVDSADARAVFVARLANAKGPEMVASWYDTQPRPLPSDLMSPLGFYNLAVSLAEAGRWQSAVEVIDCVQALEGQLPELAYLAGVLHAGLLLAPDHQPLALRLHVFNAAIRPAETSDSVMQRDLARASFSRAAAALQSIAPAHADVALQWLRWLDLTDPNPEVKERARREIAALMVDDSAAIPLVPFAVEFDVDIDAPALWQYLEKQARFGSLNPQELQAQYFLSTKVLPAPQRAEFLREQLERLETVFPRAFLVYRRIEALAEAGQVTVARALLAEERDIFPGGDATNIDAMLGDYEGQDPTETFRRLYEESPDLDRLRNLVLALWRQRQWATARPLAEELLKREARADNLELLVACLDRLSVAPSEKLSALDRHSDLVRHSKRLLSARAWALFHAGQFAEAEAALEDVASIPSAHQLQVELALQTGNWERFARIVDERFAGKDQHSSRLLLQLAALAAEADLTSDRAMQLAAAAAEAADGDPHVLAGAVDLAYRLGREGPLTADWLQRARELSGDDGPVKTVELQEFVESWAPAHRQHQQQIENLWLAGEIPLHLVARETHLSTAELFLQIPHRNATQTDARRRLIIPIVSGRRGTTLVSDGASLALDLSSLYVLWDLEVLEKVVETAGRVHLPWETMQILMEDRRRTRFHQPSRVMEARHLRLLMSREQLHVVTVPTTLPANLEREAGTRLATLLVAARDSKGLVVHSLPVEKAGTIRSEPANLGEFSNLVISPCQVVVQLHATGKIDQATFAAAVSYMAAYAPSDSSEAAIAWTTPLYLDDVSVGQLHRAGVLDTLAGSISLWVGKSTLDEVNALIEREQEGNETATSVNKLRLLLRDLISDGKVTFLPPPPAEDDEVRRFAPTLASLLTYASEVDLVCVDDRFTNRNHRFVDRTSGETFVVTTLDLLAWLRAKNQITQQDHYTALHRLRLRGFAFIPPGNDELQWHFDRLQWLDSDAMVESAELRVVRESIARWRELRIVQLPLEERLLVNFLSVGFEVLRQLWSSEETPVTRAVAFSHWLTLSVLLPLTEWLPSEGVDAVQAWAGFLAPLASPLPAVSPARQAQYLKWVEEFIEASLTPGRQEVLTVVADRFANALRRMTADETE